MDSTDMLRLEMFFSGTEGFFRPHDLIVSWELSDCEIKSKQ